MDEDAISGIIVGAAIDVHQNLGPGLNVDVYYSCLENELAKRCLRYESKVPECDELENVGSVGLYKLGILVESKVVIELKTIERLDDNHKTQLLNNLKSSKKKLGLLINFNEMSLKSGLASGLESGLMRVENNL